MCFNADVFCDSGIISISSANDKFDVIFLDDERKSAKVKQVFINVYLNVFIGFVVLKV